MAGKKINAEARWRYNALDCAATIGAYNVLKPLLNEQAERVYRAQMALEACTLAIQSRGIKIDVPGRKAVLKVLKEQFTAKVDQITAAAGEPVNPNSPKQVQKLFYGKLGLKETKNKDGRISVDESVLTRIARKRIALAVPVERGKKDEHLEHCADLASLILEARGIQKDTGMVKAKLEGGRMRTSINVAATESFRFSASKTHFQTGANLQQVKKVLRSMFIADPGMDFVQGDQDRAESNVVAYVSGDPAYIAAHQAHDTHVAVAKLIWPEAGWAGEDAADLALAEQPNFIRFFSRRDMSKRVQHALNYYPPGDLSKLTLKGKGPQHTLARLLGITVAEAYEIVNLYFLQFPGIQEWQNEVIEAVQTYQRVYYPGDFYRDFFGRPYDPATHREAISSIPQAVIGWNNHIVMYRLWAQLEEEGAFEVLMHNHDAVILQCTAGEWNSVWFPKVEPLTRIEWPGKVGTFVVPWTWNVGRNWKEVS
jgi:DNA polymerase I-like protein with 3'-5' exonuclease and polymerase domains